MNNSLPSVVEGTGNIKQNTALGPIPFASVRANGMGAPAPHPSNHPFITKAIISVIRYNYVVHHPNVEYPCRLF